MGVVITNTSRGSENLCQSETADIIPGRDLGCPYWDTENGRDNAAGFENGSLRNVPNVANIETGVLASGRGVCERFNVID